MKCLRELTVECWRLPGDCKTKEDLRRRHGETEESGDKETGREIRLSGTEIGGVAVAGMRGRDHGFAARVCCAWEALDFTLGEPLECISRPTVTDGVRGDNWSKCRFRDSWPKTRNYNAEAGSQKLEVRS